MKKIILAVILLAAAGGIVYYLLQKSKSQVHASVIDKELIAGKWKVDSMISQQPSKDSFVLRLYETDTNFRRQVYELHHDGQVIITTPSDSVPQKDTSSFTWGKNNEVIWKEKLTEPGADTFTVMKLNKNEFVLRTTDSTLIYLKKVK